MSKIKFRGVLENAGLGEMSFYLKKAKQYLSYAVFSLDNTNFSDVASQSKKVEQKLAQLRQTISELDEEIENLGTDLVKAVQEAHEKEDD